MSKSVLCARYKDIPKPNLEAGETRDSAEAVGMSDGNWYQIEVGATADGPWQVAALVSADNANFVGALLRKLYESQPDVCINFPDA